MSDQQIHNTKSKLLRHAFGQAFHPVNTGILVFIAVYICLIVYARPKLHARLTDVLDRIEKYLDETQYPQDLQVSGPVNFKNLKIDDQDHTTLLLKGTENESSILFLYPGESVLPPDPFFGCLILMGIVKGGKVTPGFLLEKKHDGKVQELVIDYEGTYYISYIGGQQKEFEIFKSAIQSYDRGEGIAFTLEGQRASVIEVFFFRIPSLRNWKRQKLDYRVDEKTGIVHRL